MSIRYIYSLLVGFTLVGCAATRQVAIDYPSVQINDPQSAQSSQSHQFLPLSGFQAIDGDDYYVRLISDFVFKGDNVSKNGCTNMALSYEKGNLSSALIFSLRNDSLKFNNEAAGFSYQATTGNCNFKFETKKNILTPWMRLDLGKETLVDYSFVSSADSDVDVPGLVGDLKTASNLLALTGVGMGVAVVGQFAGEWASPINTAKPSSTSTEKHSSESHSLPSMVTFSSKTGALNFTVFNVYSVAEGGINVFGSDTQPLGELKIYPEIIPSLLLKTTPDGLPDARDLSLEEIGYSPIKSGAGEIKLLQLIEQSQHSAKPNLKPDWGNYEEVEANCRKIKLVMKDLGFNKFDRNAFIYYFLGNTSDWKNYNITQERVMDEDIHSKIIRSYQSKNFGSCLAADDYVAMKSMGLQVNLASDWKRIDELSHKKNQVFVPLKSIERQLVSVIKSGNKTEMEQQLFPLLTSAKEGEGSVLLQNHLGDFGLEKLLVPTSEQVVVPVTANATVSNTTPASIPEMPAPIPGIGIIVSAHQLVQVFTGLAINELSCARILFDQQGKPITNMGILLFTTKEGSPRNKGGALEFEFSEGKINRIAFQSPTYKDFEQEVLDHPSVGECKIDSSFMTKLH